jgi:hypothetical protein
MPAWLQALQGLGQTALGFFKVANPSAEPKTKTDKATNWTPFLLIGGGLAAIILLVVLLKK